MNTPAQPPEHTTSEGTKPLPTTESKLEQWVDELTGKPLAPPAAAVAGPSPEPAQAVAPTANTAEASPAATATDSATDKAAALPKTSPDATVLLAQLLHKQTETQSKHRFWTLLLRWFWFALVAFIVLQLFGGGDTTESSLGSPHTAVIEIKGEIAPGGEVTADTVNRSLRAAFSDESAKGVLLVINSPGGSPVQAGMINDEIVRLKALHNKPIVAVVEETCASAAYYVAAAADSIYVNKASIVGSIGVLMDGFGFTELMKKVGVERRLMTAGENKGFLDPFSPQSEQQRAYAQKMLDAVHQQFIEVVRKGRGERLKETPEMFTGLFWTGQQSVTLGLADGLGDAEWVAKTIFKAPELVDYTARENVAERLAKRFGAAVGEGAVKAAGGLKIELK